MYTTVRELFNKLKVKYPQYKISSTLFFRCKPFFVSPATEREMECCLCAKCLTPHALYSTLRRHMTDLPASLSEYLIILFECKENTDISFPELDCTCSIVDDSGAEKYQDIWNKKVSYYQFETVLESYFNKNGIEKFFTRTARKDYLDNTLQDVYQLFQDSAHTHLTHRYHTLLDNVY